MQDQLAFTELSTVISYTETVIKKVIPLQRMHQRSSLLKLIIAHTGFGLRAGKQAKRLGGFNLPIEEDVRRLSADDDTLATGRGGDELILRGGAAGLLIGVAAARSTAVELDAVTSAGDAVTLA